MSQQTFSPGGTQVVEPPAPVLPAGDHEGTSDENKRKLLIVAAAVGVLVVGMAAFFLLKGGSSSGTSRPLPPLPPRAHTAAPAAQPPVVKLPRRVVAPVGRDPFKALYVAPAARAGASSGSAPSTTSTGGSTTTTSGGTTTTTSGGTTTPTTTKVTYHPVWVQLHSLTSTTATFDVGYSNGKTLRAVRFVGVKPLSTFATHFELLSIRGGVVTVKFGDGSPFQMDRTHNTMVVD